MKVIERLALAFSAIGLLKKILLIRPGTNEILMIGLTFLALFYLILSFALFNNIRLNVIFKKSSYALVSRGRIVGAVGLGISLWVCVTAILFKLLNLTGATEMLVNGIALLTLVLVVALIIFVTKKYRWIDLYFKNIFIRGLATLTIVITLYLLPPFTLVKLFHRDDPMYIELYIKSIENPTDARAWKEFEEYRARKTAK